MGWSLGGYRLERVLGMGGIGAVYLGRAEADPGAVAAVKVLKPTNILIGSDGGMLLTDFGITRLFGGEETTTLMGTRQILGTPNYMAPEQACSGDVTTAADV